jgi:outer membrane protein assembly factor BamB
MGDRQCVVGAKARQKVEGADMLKFRSTLWLCAILIAFSQLVSAQQWPQWRGPNRDGLIPSFTPPAKWPKNLTQRWKTAIGGGYSSPVVSQSKIFVHSSNGDNETVSCIDLKTGKIIWSENYAAPFTKNQYAREMDRGPFSTPVLYRDNLYTLGTTAILSCFNARTGKLKWRKDYSQTADTSKNFCGAAMSPIIDRGLLIVHVGDDRKGWVTAFDAETGQERWKWEGDGPGYASPIIVELENERHLVTLTDKSIIGISVDSGKLLWKLPFPDEWNENIVTPVLHGETLVISGVRQGTRAIRVTREGDHWKLASTWHNPKIAMYMSSPVLDGDLLFGLSNLRKGQLFCLDVKTGDVLWTTEGREGQNAAILQSQKEIFMLTNDADLIIANKSAKGFEPLARYKVADSSTWAHPVIMSRQILIKDAANLILWSIE